MINRGRSRSDFSLVFYCAVSNSEYFVRQIDSQPESRYTLTMTCLTVILSEVRRIRYVDK